MYQQFKQLILKRKLTSNLLHQTNLAYYLKNDPRTFLSNVEEWFQVDRPDGIFGYEECFACGEHIFYRLNGEVLEEFGDIPCYKDNEFIAEISVPSGELLLSDWPEHGMEFFKHLEEHPKSIMSIKGKTQRTQNYASENIGHFFVGNSGPHVFQDGNRLLIGSYTYDQDDNIIPFDAQGVDKGIIDTELWWTTILDRKTYLEAAVKKFGSEKGLEMTEDAVEKSDVVLQVEPGIYQLRYFTRPSEDYKLFAEFRKKEEDPPLLTD